MAIVGQLVRNIFNSDLREKALLELSKKTETVEDLALLLWHSRGIISELLREIVEIYPALSSPNLMQAASNRVCYALTLFQCVASHPETRTLFVNACIPQYLYPFLQTVDKSKPFEYLRLATLAVIGALVKDKDAEVINFLLGSGVISLCFNIMEIGDELSKTAATFIVEKVLLEDVGLDYFCETPKRFFDMGWALANMVESLTDRPSTKLLKHIISCYLRLTEIPSANARGTLHGFIPPVLRDRTFDNCLKDEPETRQRLKRLLEIVPKDNGPEKLSDLVAAAIRHKRRSI
ncbi:hypothetical protein BRADI_1g58330v3 [Brachypodium distachyon]|nr:hypothetical protein BRADI_1g58330v3 [Brachypodium distachyon]